MVRTAFKRFYAGLLLVILLAAYAGQRIHIYGADPAHVAAHCCDRLSDDDETDVIFERCIIDNYHFFPCLTQAAAGPALYCELLAVVPARTVVCAFVERTRCVSLRAPPAI